METQETRREDAVSRLQAENNDLAATVLRYRQALVRIRGTSYWEGMRMITIAHDALEATDKRTGKTCG